MPMSSSILRIMMLLTPVFISSVVHAQMAEFYVSPDGNDARGHGTLDKPWATVERARNAVRAINGDMTDNIIVYLRGGTYRLRRTITFGPTDSATNAKRITYRAYGDERPVLCGGAPVTNWAPDRDGIYRAATGGLTFRQLYVDGRPEVRAREPNLEFPGAWDSQRYKVLVRFDRETSDRCILIDRKDIAHWKRFNHVEFVFARHWSQQNGRLRSFDVRGDVAALKLCQPESDRILGSTQATGPRQTYHFENAREFLDAGGEWYLDADAETVFYKPRVDEEMSEVSVTVPRLERILEVDGADHLSFVGLQFSHSTWLYPDTHGYVGSQSGSFDHYRHALVPAGVRVANAKHLRFERCRFTNMGGSGLTLAYQTHHTQIVGNVFMNIAGNGINIYEKLKDADKSPSNAQSCFRDRIANNYIYRCGLFYNGVGINATYATQTHIEHNELCEISYSGMDLGWGSPADHQDYQITRNHVHHVMRRFDDGAGIYASEPQGDLRVTENYCHDIVRGKWLGNYPVAGLYLDQGIRGSTWDHNVVARCTTAVNFNRHSGATETNNTVTNTLGADARLQQLAGITPAYRDIKEGTAIEYPPSGYTYHADPQLEGFVPIADATLVAAAPDKNFGTGRKLTVQGNNREQRALLRFSVGRLKGRKIQSLRLGLTESIFSSTVKADFTVRCVHGNWSELRVTWNNQPELGDVLASYKGAPADGAALDIAMPVDAIPSDGVLDVGLISNTPGGDLGLGSREGYLEPRLFIEWEE